MSYSTREEVREMPKDDVLNAIIGGTFVEGPEEHEAKVAPIIESAIEDVDAEIDGYLAKRHVVPIPSVPCVLNKSSKDTAIYNLYSRLGIDEDTEEKNYLNRYNTAVKFPAFVTEGKVSIGAEAEDPTNAAVTGFSVRSSPRIFSRGSTRGM